MFESYTNQATTYAHNVQLQEDISSNTVNSSTTNTNDSTSQKQGDTWEDIFTKIFNKTTFFYLILFLGIYVFTYFLLGNFFNKSNDNSSFQVTISRMIDLLFLIFLILFIVSFVYSSNNLNKSITDKLNNSVTNYINFLITPMSILTTFFFLVIFYLIIYLLRIPTSSNLKPIFISLIETLSWLTFITICIIDFFQYILKIPIVSMIYNFWNTLPDNEANIIIDSSNNTKPKNIDNSNNIVYDEVFNVSNNIYTYDDAQAVCKVYGAKLATYDQMEDAYNDGADWCNYGWSEGQMAFFPTQKSTWLALQKDEKRKNNCGRPGINGGYIANPYFKFGVNCFGKKPQPSQDDLNRMNAQNITPKTPQDTALDAKLKYWKDNASKLLQINSYNKSKWSEY